MNAALFHNVVNRLIVSPFIGNVQVDYQNQEIDFDLKVPFFAPRPIKGKSGSIDLWNMNPMLSVEQYWKMYVQMMLMPYGQGFQLNTDVKGQDLPKAIKFQLKSKEAN